MRERFSLLRSFGRAVREFLSNYFIPILLVGAIGGVATFLVQEGQQEEKQKAQDKERIARHSALTAALSPLRSRNDLALKKTQLAEPRRGLWTQMEQKLVSSVHAAENGQALIGLTDKANISFVPAQKEGVSGYLAIDPKAGYLGLNLLQSQETNSTLALNLLREFNKRVENKAGNYYGLYSLTTSNISFRAFEEGEKAFDHFPVYELEQPPASEPVAEKNQPGTNAPVTVMPDLFRADESFPAHKGDVLSPVEQAAWEKQRNDIMSGLSNAPPTLDALRLYRVEIVPLKQQSLYPEFLSVGPGNGRMGLTVSTNAADSLRNATALLTDLHRRSWTTNYYGRYLLAPDHLITFHHEEYNIPARQIFLDTRRDWENKFVFTATNHYAGEPPFLPRTLQIQNVYYVPNLVEKLTVHSSDKAGLTLKPVADHPERSLALTRKFLDSFKTNILAGTNYTGIYSWNGHAVEFTPGDKPAAPEIKASAPAATTETKTETEIEAALRQMRENPSWVSTRAAFLKALDNESESLRTMKLDRKIAIALMEQSSPQEAALVYNGKQGYLYLKPFGNRGSNIQAGITLLKACKSNYGGAGIQHYYLQGGQVVIRPLRTGQTIEMYLPRPKPAVPTPAPAPAAP